MSRKIRVRIAVESGLPGVRFAVVLLYLECLFVGEPWLVRVTSQTTAATAATTALAPKTFRVTRVSFPKQKANF